MQRLTIDISWGSLWKVLFFLILVSLLAVSFQILIGLFLAVIISSGLEYFIDFLERQGVPRTLGVVLIFLVCALLLTVLAYTVIPLLDRKSTRLNSSH